MYQPLLNVANLVYQSAPTMTGDVMSLLNISFIDVVWLWTFADTMSGSDCYANTRGKAFIYSYCKKQMLIICGVVHSFFGLEIKIIKPTSTIRDVICYLQYTTCLSIYEILVRGRESANTHNRAAISKEPECV